MGLTKTWNDLLRLYGHEPEQQNRGNQPGAPQPSAEWQMIYQKFRNRVGRDPYSVQELEDWWHGL